jgi:hypothetical protein
LNALRKAAQGFDVVGRHWPVGKVHGCPAPYCRWCQGNARRRVGMP